MENKVVGFIPKILFKIFLYLKERFDPKKPIPEEEKITIEICSKLIDLSGSKLTIAPISNKRFIKNSEKKIFIVIENNSISLVNDIYNHSVYVTNDELYHELCKKFDECLDNERLRLENEIKNNIEHSLQEILIRIQN
jgi:hypothetical protein